MMMHGFIEQKDIGVNFQGTGGNKDPSGTRIL